MTGELIRLPMPHVRFLDLPHVLEVHARVLLRHGGADGVRDEKLLYSLGGDLYLLTERPMLTKNRS